MPINEDLSQETRDRWNEIIQNCQNSCDELTDWESDFIDSISIQLSKEDDLTFKQSRSLYNIADKYGY